MYDEDIYDQEEFDTLDEETPHPFESDDTVNTVTVGSPELKELEELRQYKNQREEEIKQSQLKTQSYSQDTFLMNEDINSLLEEARDVVRASGRDFSKKAESELRGWMVDMYRNYNVTPDNLKNNKVHITKAKELAFDTPLKSRTTTSEYSNPYQSHLGKPSERFQEDQVGDVYLPEMREKYKTIEKKYGGKSQYRIKVEI